MGYEYNSNFAQAASSVGYAQQYAPQQAAQYQQQAPVSFGSAQQAAYAPQVQQEEGGLSLGKILLGAGVVVAGVAAHKSNAVRGALKEAQVAKEEIPSFTKLMGKFINPMSWFKNGESLKALEGKGFTKVGENMHLIQNEAGEKFILTGNKVLNHKGEAAEELTKAVTEFKATPQAAEETAEEAAKTASKRTPSTVDENIQMAQNDVTRVDGSIKKIESKIAELEQRAQLGDKNAEKAIGTLESKLAVLQKAKAIKEVEALEAQKLQLEAVQANSGADKSKEITEITDKINSKISEAKNNGFLNIEDRLSANKAYKENQIIRNASEGIEATHYEQAYANLDGKGIFKQVDHIENGKFVEKLQDGKFGELTIDKKLGGNQIERAYQTSTNKVNGAQRKATALADRKSEAGTLLNSKLEEKDVTRLQQLATELNTNLNISAVPKKNFFGFATKNELQISQTFADGSVLTKTGDEAVAILTQRVHAAA